MHLLVNGNASHVTAPIGDHLNKTEPGLGFQYDGNVMNKKWVPLIAASGFSNSNENPSYYAGGGVLLALSVGSERLSVDIPYSPKVEPKMVVRWFFQLKIKLVDF